MEQNEFDIKLTLEDKYRMTVDFGMDGVPDLLVDEPEPLGDGAGPNASRVLAAAVGNCLSASLMFCLGKSRVEVQDVETEVHVKTKRNENGRWRIAHVQARIRPTIADGERKRIERCLGLFEDFCIVTASVRDGIDVEVEVDLD